MSKKHADNCKAKISIKNITKEELYLKTNL